MEGTYQGTKGRRGREREGAGGRAAMGRETRGRGVKRGGGGGRGSRRDDR